jgi:hypothetical protein
MGAWEALGVGEGVDAEELGRPPTGNGKSNDESIA